MNLVSINPATGETVQTYPETTEQRVSEILDSAVRAQVPWSRAPLDGRAERMKAMASALRQAQEPAARLMAVEMGKPISQGRAEVEKCAWLCEYAAENAEGLLRSIDVGTDARKSYVAMRPLGVILAVMPWNFPYWQIFRAAVPALLAGNTMVLKHASNICGCSLAIEELFRAAGFPAGAFSSLLLDSRKIEAIVKDPRIQAVTLTGSTDAGRAVARAAGETIKKCVLELGGSDPYLVLEDADLDLAARTCAASRLINSGQSCIAAKRFIVVESVLKSFEERFIREMTAFRVGDPLDESTRVGPLARRDLRDTVSRQVERTVSQGARVLLGGPGADGKGFYYPATILGGVRKGMTAFDEEVFGPVASVVSAGSEGEAIRIANDSSFGLGAAVFTRDSQRGERIAAIELEAGNCFVNALVRSDPRLPFGGIKESGFGRELGSFGIHEFVNIKTVYVG